MSSKNMGKNKAFYGLLLASVFCLFFIREPVFREAWRNLIPIYKQITWHWRGTAIWVLWGSVLFAMGYAYLFKITKHLFWFKWLLLILMLGYLCQLSFVFSSQWQGDKLNVRELSINPFPFNKPCDYSTAECKLGYIFGYTNEKPSVMSSQPQLPLTQVIGSNSINVHDVRVLASNQANNGYYLNNQWPLFDIKDKSILDKFLNYHQVVDLPSWLVVVNTIAPFIWGIFILLFIYLLTL